MGCNLQWAQPLLFLPPPLPSSIPAASLINSQDALSLKLGTVQNKFCTCQYNNLYTNYSTLAPFLTHHECFNEVMHTSKIGIPNSCFFYISVSLYLTINASTPGWVSDKHIFKKKMEINLSLFSFQSSNKRKKLLWMMY